MFSCFCGAFRKQRYVYGTILDSIAKVTGIIKFDLHAEAETGKKILEVGGNIKGIYEMGQGTYGSDAIYVPGATAEEDDGYLIFYAHDENTGYYLFLSMLYHLFYFASLLYNNMMMAENGQKIMCECDRRKNNVV